MFRLVAAIAAAALASIVAPGAQRGAPTRTAGCAAPFDAGADAFPDKIQVQDAVNFSVEYARSYKVVTVKDPSRGGAAERYVLLACGAPRSVVPASLRTAPIIDVPIRTLFAYSTTHLAPLVELHRTDVVTGVAQLGDVTAPQVRARIKAGQIVEFTNSQLDLDPERVVASHPSMLMVTSGSIQGLPAIRAAGVPVVVNSEWLEHTPLGRAEWLKFVALFLNEERQAQAAYTAIKTGYDTLRQRTAAVPALQRPLVMTGRSEHGVFTIGGGGGYVAAVIKDAGGRYIWADNPSTGIISVDFEAQLQRGGNADFWLNGFGWRDLRSVLADDPRNAEFKAFKTGQVWVYDLTTPAQGNDYWSRSVTHPEILLADMVKIFHPAMVPNHAFAWYRRLPQ